jgi:hypothetical protein
MSDDTVAYQHLLSTLLEIHAKNRSSNDFEDVDFVDFSETEIQQLAESLWANRFSESRTDFQDLVGKLVAEKTVQK